MLIRLLILMAGLLLVGACAAPAETQPPSAPSTPTRGASPTVPSSPSPVPTQPTTPQPTSPAVGTPSTNPTPSSGMPISSPFMPQSGDEKLTRATVFLDNSNVMLLESFPVQARLQLKGSLPTPCHKLRVAVSPPDAQNQIMVEVYSVVAPDQMCLQVLQSFDASVSLGTFSRGTYSVWVNGAKLKEFTV